MGLIDNSASRTTITGIIAGVGIAVLISLLPSYPLPAEIREAFSWVFSSLWKFDFLIPVATIIQLVSLAVILEITGWTIKGIMVALNIYNKLKT